MSKVDESFKELNLRSFVNSSGARADGSGPSIVRLGDQNLSTRRDGLTEVDVPIAEFISHENYKRNSYYDDIAVIKMSRSVE